MKIKKALNAKTVILMINISFLLTSIVYPYSSKDSLRIPLANNKETSERMVDLIIVAEGKQPSNRRIIFGHESVKDVDMLLPLLKKYQFPASEIALQIPAQYQKHSLSLEDVITSQPPNDRYIFPAMAGHEQDYKRIRELHLLIADADFVVGKPGLREAVNEFVRLYPQAKDKIERIMQDTQLNNKGKKVNIINLLYEQAGIPLVQYSLLQHARDEFNIVTSLINGNADFQKSIISQTLKAQDILKETEKSFGNELRILRDDKSALNFLAHFLLLHDLGKFILGEENHERRSAAILDIIFRGDYFNFSPFEKKLLRRMIGLHSAIEKINSSPDIEQEFKELAEEAVRDRFFTEAELLNIVRVVIIFRIAEPVESGHFAFIYENTFPDLVNVYNTAKRIVNEAYTLPSFTETDKTHRGLRNVAIRDTLGSI